MEYINNPYFLLALTFVVYGSAQLIQRRTRFSLFNPILVTIALIIVFLMAYDIPYDTYNQYGRYIEFWLKPAVVALAVPLYKQLSTVKKQLLPITLSALGGCISGIISVVWVADVCGASHDVVMSLAAKSVTTPIAMEVTSSLGGIPSLTAAVVVSVGIFGGIVGFGVMRWSRVHSPIAQGLSMGTAAHAVGSSRAFGISDRYVLLPVSDSRSTASSQPSSLRRFCISSDISKGWKVECTQKKIVSTDTIFFLCA